MSYLLERLRTGEFVIDIEDDFDPLTITYNPEWVFAWYIIPTVEPRLLEPYMLYASNLVSKCRQEDPNVNWYGPSGSQRGHFLPHIWYENVVEWIKENCNHGVGIHVYQERGFFLENIHMIFENRDEAILFKLTF